MTDGNDAARDETSGIREDPVAGIARKTVRHGVTINNLLPGSFDTDRLRGTVRAQAAAKGVDFETELETRRNSIPAGRLGLPEEFGAVCAFLCSTYGAYITGQNILVDGGAYPGTF